MAKHLYPYINKFNGEVKVLTKSQGKKLNEDWSHGKVVNNDKGEPVFRFEIATPVIGKDGKTHMGIATIDISQVETKEVDDGNRSTK